MKAQDWLDINYPKKKGFFSSSWTDRKEITKLNISKQNLWGDLDLSDFVNLKGLNCSSNYLTSLNLSNCSQLEQIYCDDNLLTNLTLPINPTNLKKIDLENNNFSNQDLSFLVGATNLEIIYLTNNHFTGSLDYLSEMKCLKWLGISATDINEVNINKLPRSLKEIRYSTEYMPNCQLTKIVPQLEKHFGKFGRCLKCWLAKTSENWCQHCADQEWQADLAQLTGQELVEKFIQQQPTSTSTSIYSGEEKLQWIPYWHFTNIEYLAEGGFSKIYKAKWIGMEDWKSEVVLKSLTNSQNITLEFLTEIVNTKLVDDYYIVKCYGISQDPKTENYVMVMKYMPDGNLQQFLKNNFAGLTWWKKIRKLKDIAEGLKKIHDQNLIHHDFHSGNILNSKKDSYITDLGLSRPANSQKEEGEIFGVIPYVAPEVLQGQPYTQASDIYSFGIIMYEILTGLPPYHDRKHDTDLALNICQGLRPKFRTKITQLLEDLINRCWDAEPKQRPSVVKLFKVLDVWNNEILYRKTTPFTQQIQEADKINFCQPLTKLYQQYRGQSKEVKPEEVEEIKKELFTEFCQENNYGRGTYKAEKEFRKLLFPNPNYEIHQGAVYHSKAINTKQITQLLSKSQEQFGSSEIPDMNDFLDKFANASVLDKEEQAESSTQTQIEIPPKNK